MNELATTSLPHGGANLTQTGGAEAQRLAILSVATQLFTQYGFAKTTIGDIAAGCSMSPANLYRYFRNKQSIGCAVAGIYMENMNRICTEAAERAAPTVELRLRATVRAQVNHTVTRLREVPKMVELAEMVVDAEEGRALLARQIERRTAQVADLIAEGVAAGEFRALDVDRAARGFLTGLKFFFAPFALARHGLDSIDDDLSATLDLLCAGLRAG